MVRSRSSSVALFALAALCASSGIAQPTITHYAVAGGQGAAAIRLDDGRLDTFRGHIYNALDDGLVTPELCFDAYLGVRRPGVSHWLTDVAPTYATVPDTNVLTVTQVDGPLEITTTIFAPWGIGVPAVVMMAEVTNTGGAELSGVSFPTIANFHVGDGMDQFGGERALYDTTLDSFVETGAQGALVVRALVPSAVRMATPNNPFPIVTNDEPYVETTDSGIGDDIVHGFVFEPPAGTLAAGATYTFAQVLASTEDASTGGVDALQAALTTWIDSRTPAQLRDAEVAAAEAYVASADLPAGLSDDERLLAGYSLALLRAAQVLEDGAGTPGRRPRGQIVASLPPGIWNITWVRDAAYAIEGLLDVGKGAEAEAALRFMLDGTANEYRDPYVGIDYLLSVTRYWGGGREESDWNASGPNVEWDNFGLFLHAYAHALEDGIALDDRLADVKSGVADVLVFLIDPATSILLPDSSIWETHWDPSGESVGRRQYAYSTAVAVSGLDRFADVLEGLSDPDAATYRAAADTLRQGMLDELVTPTGFLAASREERISAPTFAKDASVVEAFNRAALPAGDALAQTTLDEMSGLTALASPGYFRNDEGGAYDTHEWLVIDLWLSRAFRRAGDTTEADRLIDHVTATGLANLGHIPELLHSDDGRAFGSIPMMGFGPGAYLTALVHRADDDALGATAGDGDGDDEPTDGGADGGSSTDGGAVRGDGDGDAPTDAGVDEEDAGAPFVGDGDGDAPADAGVDERDAGAPVVGDGDGDIVVLDGDDAGTTDGGDAMMPACRCVDLERSPPLAALLLFGLALVRRRRD